MDQVSEFVDQVKQFYGLGWAILWIRLFNLLIRLSNLIAQVSKNKLAYVKQFYGLGQ